MSSNSLWIAAIVVVFATSTAASQQHPFMRLGLLVGWRAAVQTSEVDPALNRRVALGARPDVIARARWNADRHHAIGVLAEASWSTQSTAVGQGTTNVVTQLDHLVGALGVAVGPLWLGVGYAHPLYEHVQAVDIDGTRISTEHHHDGSRLAPATDLRLGCSLPIIVTDVGDVDVSVVVGTALSSAYQASHPSMLRAAWLRVDVGWMIELW